LNIEGEDLEIVYRAIDNLWSENLSLMANKRNSLFSSKMREAYLEDERKMHKLLLKVKDELVRRNESKM
jgi:hypothetical protein